MESVNNSYNKIQLENWGGGKQAKQTNFLKYPFIVEILKVLN